MPNTRKKPSRRKRPSRKAARTSSRRSSIRTAGADVQVLGRVGGGTPTSPITAQLRLSQIRLAEGVNPRWDPGDLDQLMASIREQGLLQQLVVRLAKGSKCYLRDRAARFEVVAGERRLRVLQALKWKHPVPVLIRTDLDDDNSALAAALAENSEDGRHNLNVVEVHCAIERLIDAGWSRTRIAKETGLHKQTVHEAIKVLRAPEEIRRKVAECDLSSSAALALAQVCDDVRDDVVENVRKKATALDIRRLRMDTEAQRSIDEEAEVTEPELSNRLSPTAWRQRRAKRSSLRSLCREIVRLQEDDADPYDVDLVQARAMAWTLLWDRGDISGDILPVAIPDPQSRAVKAKRELKRFESLIAREAAAAAQDDEDDT